jgi:hypothetical protein
MTIKPADIINDLIKRYASLREFARAIREDGSDVMRWRHERGKVRPRAVIKICELFPEYKPHDLNPEVFPAHLTLHFGEHNE